jgi:hypothetical protein
MSATASLPTRSRHRATTAITADHVAPTMFAMDAMLSRLVAQFKMPRLDAYGELAEIASAVWGDAAGEPEERQEADL